MADTAANAAGTARIATEVAYRANVAIESILLRDPRPVGNRRIADRATRSCIEITVRNHGATPAKEMSFEFHAAMPPYIEQPVSLVSKTAELHTHCSAISTFRPIGEMSGEFFKEADVNLFLDDLRIDGHIRYRDIFGNGYKVECSATFDPASWQFQLVTNVKSGM